jgi:hypothetical protein
MKIIMHVKNLSKSGAREIAQGSRVGLACKSLEFDSQHKKKEKKKEI